MQLYIATYRSATQTNVLNKLFSYCLILMIMFRPIGILIILFIIIMITIIIIIITVIIIIIIITIIKTE